MRAAKKILVSFIFVSILSNLVLAQTGRIQGTVTDAQTGQPLVGANVLIVGTTMGAATNLEGYYSILNVPPGEYDLRISMIGYDPVTVTNVRVYINQITDIDVALTETALELEEVVIVAQRPIVQRDVAASTVNVSAQEIQSLPVTTVTGVVSLQPGIQGLTVRGAAAAFDPVAFMVDGLTLRDERDNTPYTNISFTSVEEIQIQTGGFAAEYGNVRSGIINVVTREGRRDRYTFDMLVRHRPPGPKYLGRGPSDPNSYFMRPFLDDAVAWTGTNNGAWDIYTQRHYPSFVGWNAIAEQSLADGNPETDLTPQQAQQLFLWQHRKKTEITKPDQEVDFSIGGPVPLISSALGDLRFHASYRQVREMYVVPLHTDSYQDYNAQIKITSDLRPGMKLMIEALQGESWGTTNNNVGEPGIFRSPTSIAEALQRQRASFLDARIFTTDYWAPTRIRRSMIGGKFTHALSATTFYEVILQQFNSRYETNPGKMRDTTRVYNIGGYLTDEAPFGFWPFPSNAINGMRMGVGMSNSRDSSEVRTFLTKFDITSQINRYNELKAGFEFVYTDNYVNYGSVDEYLPAGRHHSVWRTYPLRGGLYVQNKVEFEGMIANLGVRLDYSHAGSDWYVFDPFDRAFSGQYAPGIDTLLAKERTDHILHVSPRLGISFPITENSKLYFNYGHFRSMPRPDDLYMLRRLRDTNAIVRIGDPNAPMQRTVAYELGYEHNLFDMVLLRVAGYYRDITLQPRLVQFQTFDGTVNYQRTLPDNYRDVRGFEISLNKRPGSWWAGFINYTYMVTTFGNFGFSQYTNNPTVQREYERTFRGHYQQRPVPEPYARMNLDFYTPPNFGPQFAGIDWFGNWRLSLLGVWESGFYFTWTGEAPVPGISNNMQWRDYYNFDLRLTKNFQVMGASVQFFVDMTNVFNLKHMTANRFYPGYGFVDGDDFNRYMKSLHHPERVGRHIAGHVNIPGNDRPGDYRRSGVDFHPMEGVVNLSDVRDPHPRPIYYEQSSGRYFQWRNGEWTPADPELLSYVLDNRAYIEMPNMEFLTFLNPRNIFFGLRVSIGL